VQASGLFCSLLALIVSFNWGTSISRRMGAAWLWFGSAMKKADLLSQDVCCQRPVADNGVDVASGIVGVGTCPLAAPLAMKALARMGDFAAIYSKIYSQTVESSDAMSTSMCLASTLLNTESFVESGGGSTVTMLRFWNP